MVWEEKVCCEEFDLHADICNLGSGFLATNFAENPCVKGA